MKYIIITGLAACLAVTTVPADQYCVKQSIAKMTGITIAGEIAASTALQGYLYRVDNHIFYKTVSNRLTGRVIAYAALGNVFTAKY